MAIQKENRDDLKKHFLNGAFPTEEDFANLIESQINQLDDGIKIDANKNVGIGVEAPTAKLHVQGAILVEEADTATPDKPENTILYHNTTKQGKPNPEGLEDLFGDGFRIIHKHRSKEAGTDPVTVTNYDYLIIEKTDGNQEEVDGGVLFRSRNDKNEITDCLVIKGTGKVGIGTLNPQAELDVRGNALKEGGGNWGSPSDERIKTDIQNFEDGLEKLKAVKPIKFKYNGKGGLHKDDKVYIGVKAQELQEVFPYMIDTYQAKLEENDSQPTDLLEVNTSAMIYVVINAIKELDNRLSELEKTVKNK